MSRIRSGRLAETVADDPGPRTPGPRESALGRLLHRLSSRAPARALGGSRRAGVQPRPPRRSPPARPRPPTGGRCGCRRAARVGLRTRRAGEGCPPPRPSVRAGGAGVPYAQERGRGRGRRADRGGRTRGLPRAARDGVHCGVRERGRGVERSMVSHARGGRLRGDRGPRPGPGGGRLALPGRHVRGEGIHHLSRR